MATMTKHAPGAFCWVELATTDAAAAKAFYTRLFGWTFEDSPMGPEGVYTFLRLNDRKVGALFGMTPKSHPAGTPSHWVPYIATDDADATARLVAAHGGRVVAQPFDVMEDGRMVIVEDPAGAMFAAWQGKRSPGLEVKDEPGSLGWMQLNAPDPSQASSFYHGVFGWNARHDPMEHGGSYTTFMSGLERRGGGMPMPPDAKAPAHWLTYFAVADVDDTAGKAAQLGGSVMMPPMDIPGVARMAVLSDPQGAFFAIVKFAG